MKLSLATRRHGLETLVDDACLRRVESVVKPKSAGVPLRWLSLILDQWLAYSRHQMQCSYGFMPNTDWPIKPCKHCGVDIRLVKTRFGWAPYETKRFEPHMCGRR